MEYGFDDEIKEENQQEEEKVISLDEKKKRKPFAYWTVGGKDYKLKLTTASIVKLEEKFKRNLLTVLESSGIPPLAVMLTITQAAMKDWEHGIKYETVQKLFDQYCDEGGTQLTFMMDVLMEIFKVSGFFSESQMEAMDDRIQDAKELL